MSPKVIKHKNDLMHSSSESKTPSNVNTLRKLFENNFKLSNITNAFKSKSNHYLATNKNSNFPKNVLDIGLRSRHLTRSSDCKENRGGEIVSPLTATSDGCYLNCQIENCRCKTFFRLYNETPVFKNRPLSKLQLQERSNNSTFNRHRPERWSAASCSSYHFNKQHQHKLQLHHQPHHHCPVVEDNLNNTSELAPHRFHCINYEFCRSKSQEIFDETPVSAVSTKRLKSVTSKTGRSINLFEKITESENTKGDCDDDNAGSMHSSGENFSKKSSNKNTLPFQRNEASGFVNFTAASLNEGGYVKAAKDFSLATNGSGVEQEVFFHHDDHKGELKCRMAAEALSLFHKIDLNGKIVESSFEGSELYRTGGFRFKHRVPKLKNIALREHSHPYSVKRSRLTVKGVKNRNMRNVKRRQKLVDGSELSRSLTFNGYDNLAYRRSITELYLSKPPSKVDADDDELADAGAPSAVTVSGDNADGANFCGPRPASISVMGVDEGPQFRLDSRMTSYNWPVTSFYIKRNDVDVFEVAPRRYSSSFDLSSKPSGNERSVNPVARKTNLKRHCSLGYLESEFFEYNFTRHRRLLENENKVSATCGIRNIHEVNNKIIKQRKFQNLDIHVHALFAAVEHGYVEKTKTILESSEVDVNSVNSDGLSPLDVAVLSNNKPLVKLLVAYGAQEGRKFYSADDMRNHLYHLLHEAERRVQELGSSLRLNIESDQSSLSSSSSNIPSITIGDSAQNKTYSIWERRAKGLKRMLMGFEQIRPPDLPAVVTIEVTSTSSVIVYFAESDNKDSSITTKFRVQWSTDKDFSSLCGHYEVGDTRQLRYHIKNLRKGQSYYVRVASGNIKGYSAYKLSTPSFIVPSSWLDITEKDIRFSNSMRDTLDNIFTNVVVTHPYLKSNVELYGQGGELLVNQRRKKTSIKQLFTAASKFQKHLRRGVYLACLLYHEDKILVTNEDFLPVIEVDENYPKKIHNDFHWFFKVAFSWNDLKWLKSDMEKSQNSSAVFRIKLLQAAVHMQTALSIQELGKLYHKMLRDVEGTIVISVINYIHSPKSVSVLNLRWMPLAKLTKRANIVNFAESNVADILMASIPDQITYHQVSKIKLPRGLYLSYLKMRSSVDSLQVLVPSRTPNMPPHCKIRDNPHVTAEEWEWLVKKENLRESLTTATYQQRLFIEQIVITARRLFTHMDVPEAETFNHRLYDAEVIEISKDVSLIMVVPPAEASCSMPGQRELLLQRSDMLPLTVQVFEMVHFGTYQLDLISMYSRLSCIIEMDVDLAQHCLRKAFNALEVSTAKSKLNELETLHAQLNVAWKKSRWLLDVISFARDRLTMSPTTMRQLLNVHPKRTLPSIESHCYLQPPDPKTAKSRGSWPGVGIGRHLGRMPNEISRSEQHLTSESISVTSTQTTMKCSSAKASSPIERASENEDMNFVTRSTSADLNEQADGSRSSKYNPNAQPISGNSSSGSTLSISSDELSTSRVGSSDDVKDENGVRVPVPGPAVIKYVAAFAVSAVSCNWQRIGKPFNPLLGETYEMENEKFRVVCEQVSHHPPISAFHAENETFIFRGSIYPKLKFWGKSVEIQPEGVVTVELKKWSEAYTWSNVTCSVHNVVVGKIWIEQSGTMEIVNHRTGHKAILNFKPAGWFNKDTNRVEGFIYDASKRKLRFLFGKWSEYMKCTDVQSYEEYMKENSSKFKFGDSKNSGDSTPSPNTPKRVLSKFNSFKMGSSMFKSMSQAERDEIDEPDTGDLDESKSDSVFVLDIPNSITLWEVNPRQEKPLNGENGSYHFSEFTKSLNKLEPHLIGRICHTDSRYRPDIKKLENNDLDGAASEKNRLEEKQREVRSLRKRKKLPEWNPRWFHLKTNPYTNQEDWFFNNKYWDRNFPADPDIF